ncbi:hypothetical protein [Streptomyces atratus]|uniref:hypothetical protein n=1 Tax=Streptomyces atratus TaxID=1893 RepID=UPI002B1D4AEB|nr:hypothetical protein [Streptomyces atratus]
MSVLSGLEWERPDLFQPHLNHLSQLDGKLTKVDNWLLLAPQLSRSSRIEASILGSSPFSLVRRSRQAGKTAFGRIASVEHRTAAQRIIDGAESPEGATSTSTGVILPHPVIEGQSDVDTRAAAPNDIADPPKLIMAFTLIPPTSAIDSSHPLLRFQAKDTRHASSIVVPNTSD